MRAHLKTSQIYLSERIIIKLSWNEFVYWKYVDEIIKIMILPSTIIQK